MELLIIIIIVIVTLSLHRTGDRSRLSDDYLKVRVLYKYWSIIVWLSIGRSGQLLSVSQKNNDI